jgi:hypothetical protein
MASSTPSRSIEFDSSLPDTRLRSLSLSSSSQASHSVAREPLSRRSQTPKAKRKNVSIRSIPYMSPALPRARQSRNSTTAVVNNNHELDDSIDLSSPQNQLNQEQDAFERSSDDEKEVSYFDIIHLFC